MGRPKSRTPGVRFPVFDLDGTLLDSDAALTAAFVALGVPIERVTFGHVVAEECAPLGIALDDYLDAYDTTASPPFPGVQEAIRSLSCWGVCSNKHPRSGHAELARLGWQPEVALFADAFDGPKSLEPILDALGLPGERLLFVGDTDHDRQCAAAVGATFALAAWNPRARPQPGDVVLTAPAEVVELLSVA